MSAAENLATLKRFHAAFAARDGVAMGECYGADATFRDPVFDLAGKDIGAMWRMLCSRGLDLRVESSNLEANADSGRAEWEAWYSFSATGRPVHNIVRSEFRFNSGKISSQVDRFDFWRWSRQALGPVGALLGWTPLLRNKVQANARAALQQFMSSEQRTR
ncbi:MAG TPA: nuclear transport factor 2 family protein [Dokdonella sp.]|jgi:ketosteroid isomerase-like protein|nr:nuclear transport factor 2 family protein [Dokdonella sp.]